MEKYYRLSHPQKRILTTHYLYDGSAVCNIGGYVSYSGDVNIEKLKQAISTTIAAMDAMRLRIVELNGEYMQYVSDEKTCCEFLDIDDQTSEDAVEMITKKVMEKPFELLGDCLYRIKIFSCKSGVSGYILCLHHIIMDGWSVQLFVDSVCRAYESEDISLCSYIPFIEKEDEYINSERGRKDEDYWYNFKKLLNLTDINKERNCSGIREQFILENKVRSQFESIAKLYNGENVILTACFMLMDYFRCGTGIVDIPNFNRTDRQQRNAAGMFTSTVLTMVNIDDNTDIRDLMKKTRTAMFESYRHQRWPYDLMGIDSSKEPFRYSVNYYNTDLSQNLGDAPGKYHEIYPGVQAIPAQVILKSWGNECSISVDMRKDLYLSGDGEAFYCLFRDFINYVYNHENGNIGEFRSIIKANQLERQSTVYCDTNLINKVRASSLYKSLMNSFEDISFNQTVIINDNGEISKKQLLEYISGGVAEYRRLKLDAGDKIVICMHNCVEYIAYVYAAVFMGIVFIPVDHEYPLSHIKYIFNNSQAKFIVTHEELEGLPCIIPVLTCGKIIMPEEIDDSRLAYILYTSGTTGNPKGVMISRKALISYVTWAAEEYGSETFFMHSSPSFDLSITTLFVPVINNGRIALVSKENANMYKLAELPIASEITAIKATPSNLALLLKHNTSRLKIKVFVCGGEELTVALAAELQERFGPQCRIYNEYGPTECTVGCMCYLFNGDNKTKAVSIGNAAPGSNIYVMDSEGRICITGRSGELCISGEQLADGYWELPEETDKAFCHNTYLNCRIYKSGDMARYTPDGTVEYLGRIGRQEKVNGYRIELDSVERVLKSIDEVKNAAVWIKNERLIAAVETNKYNEKELADIMSQTLPNYCVPHYFLIIENIPITVNGKINYHKLDDILDSRKELSVKNAYIHEGMKEIDDLRRKVLEDAVRSVLGYDGLIGEFNFFVHGGDSIRALRVIAAIEQKGFHISLAEILDHPVFEEMAEFVKCPEILANHFSKEFKLPSHIKYLEKTCDDFTKYRQTMTVKIDKELSSVEIDGFVNKITEVFPILCMKYINGLLVYTSETPDFSFGNYSEMNNDREELVCTEIQNYDGYSLIRFNIHHMLIDGTAWFQLLQSTAEYFSGDLQRMPSFIDYSDIDAKLEYEWEEYTYYGNSGKEYKAYNRDISINTDITRESVINAIKDSLFGINLLKDYCLLYDHNGRTEIYGNTNMGLGCYSIMIPVTNNPISANIQINKILKSGKIKIPGEKCIRINYMGNIEELMAEVGFSNSIVYMKNTIEQNLQNCSAYGCDIEVTAWLSENRSKMKFYLSSRTSILNDNTAEDIFRRIQNGLESVEDGCGFWTEEEEKLLLAEIEGETDAE